MSASATSRPLEIVVTVLSQMYRTFKTIFYFMLNNRPCPFISFFFMLTLHPFLILVVTLHRYEVANNGCTVGGEKLLNISQMPQTINILHLSNSQGVR